jgi:hypothetical protein
VGKGLGRCPVLVKRPIYHEMFYMSGSCIFSSSFVLTDHFL